MKKCHSMPVPPPVTPGPSSYTPSRLYPDYWNNLRPEHIPMHHNGHMAPACPCPPAPCDPCAPVVAPRKVTRTGADLSRKGNVMPTIIPDPTPCCRPAPPPPPCPCPPRPCTPPSPGGFTPPAEAATKVYRGTVTLVNAGENVTVDETRTQGIIQYTVNSKDEATQQIVSSNSQKIEAIEEKLPELEVDRLTNEDIDDIFNLV